MTGATAGLAELAEDPDRWIDPPEGSELVLDDRFCIVVGPDRRWASVCRLRLPEDPAELRNAVAEIRHIVAGTHVTWSVGSSATPAGLPDRLRGLGLRDPDPPLDPRCAALTLTDEPPGAGSVEVRRITTLEEHQQGVQIMLRAAPWSDEAASEATARAAETFGRRTRRGGFQWLAWWRGEPVAWAMADRSHAGLFLAGGATLPDARGHGCYRALVRARWDESVRLGLDGLAVQAQHGSSAPILRRLGFTEVAAVHTLQS